VREGLVTAWKNGDASVGVFRVGIRCLWLTLLEVNARYRAINELDGVHSALALDRLPDGLPDALDSKSLRAFLTNVRNEMRSCRQRLDACYAELLGASDNFFEQQSKSGPRPGAWRDKAEDFRDEQSRRRNEASQQRAGASIKTSRDIEALRYFGFSDFPAQDELRRKYLELARKYHPDAGTGHEEKFKTLGRVYEHLLQRCNH
jgi:hypothetical protein